MSGAIRPMGKGIFRELGHCSLSLSTVMPPSVGSINEVKR